ncbi:hypothetical protein Tco_1048149 [Tanacetum coccineum]
MVMLLVLTVAAFFKEVSRHLLAAAEQLDDGVNHARIVFILCSLIGFAGIKAQAVTGFPFDKHEMFIKCSITSLLFFGIACVTQVFTPPAYKRILCLAEIACLICSIGECIKRGVDEVQRLVCMTNSVSDSTPVCVHSIIKALFSIYEFTANFAYDEMLCFSITSRIKLLSAKYNFSPSCQDRGHQFANVAEWTISVADSTPVFFHAIINAHFSICEFVANCISGSYALRILLFQWELLQRAYATVKLFVGFLELAHKMVHAPPDQRLKAVNSGAFIELSPKK